MKILVIKLRGIGDCLLSTPTIRALREKYTESFLAVLTEDKCAPIFEGNKDLNEIIKIPAKSNIFYMVKLILNIRKQKFDIVVDLFGNPRSAIITLFSKAKTRVGMDLRFRKFCYNKRVKGSSHIKYAVEANLDVVRAIGADTKDKKININISEEDKLFAEDFLKKCGQSRAPEGSGDSPHFFIAINPVAGWETKSWGIEKFALISDELIKKYNASILILCGPEEKNIGKKIADLMKGKSIILPETTLKQFSAILSKCDLLITNDGMAKHIAVALNVPSITIFGATNPLAWHPMDNKRHIAIYKDIDCRPCDKTKCENMICLKEISVEDCLKVVEKLSNVKG